MKLLIKLTAVALVANATWRVGSEYATHYRFADSVQEAALDTSQSDAELRRRVLELAAKYGVPLTEEAFTVRRENRRRYIEGSYSKPITFLPGYARPWVFRLSVDSYLVGAPSSP